MIELTPQGFLDYTQGIRRLSRARGAVSPLMSETLTPTVDISPDALHVYSSAPRIAISWTGTVSAAGSASRFIHNPANSGVVLVVRTFFATWAIDAVLTNVNVVHLGGYTPAGAAGGVAFHVNVPVELAFASPLQSYDASGGATTLNILRFSARQTLGGLPDDAFALYPGFALQVTGLNSDAAGRDLWWGLGGRLYTI